jgi:hypothetical protein
MRSLKYPLILMALMLGSCHKIVQLPDTPYIKFTSFAVFDTTDILGNDCKGGRLKFYFEDGNGDLGLNDAESGVTDTTNLFLTLYRKTSGIMTEVPDNDLMKPSGYRIPYMERTGQNKILKRLHSFTSFTQSPTAILSNTGSILKTGLITIAIQYIPVRSGFQ